MRRFRFSASVWFSARVQSALPRLRDRTVGFGKTTSLPGLAQPGLAWPGPARPGLARPGPATTLAQGPAPFARAGGGGALVMRGGRGVIHTDSKPDTYTDSRSDRLIQTQILANSGFHFEINDSLFISVVRFAVFTDFQIASTCFS